MPVFVGLLVSGFHALPTVEMYRPPAVGPLWERGTLFDVTDEISAPQIVVNNNVTDRRLSSRASHRTFCSDFLSPRSFSSNKL